MDGSGGNSALGQAMLLGLDIEAVQPPDRRAEPDGRALRREQHRWRVGGSGELGRGPGPGRDGRRGLARAGRPALAGHLPGQHRHAGGRAGWRVRDRRQDLAGRPAGRRSAVARRRRRRRRGGPAAAPGRRGAGAAGRGGAAADRGRAAAGAGRAAQHPRHGGPGAGLRRAGSRRRPGAPRPAPAADGRRAAGRGAGPGLPADADARAATGRRATGHRATDARRSRASRTWRCSAGPSCGTSCSRRPPGSPSRPG